MKSKWLRSSLLGVAVFIIVVAGTLLFLRHGTGGYPELTFDEVIAKIGKGQIRDLHFRQSAVEVTDVDGKRHLAYIENDATREELFFVVRDYNKSNVARPITMREGAAPFRFGWIILIQAAQIVLFFVFLTVALGIISWAVRTISGNKG